MRQSGWPLPEATPTVLTVSQKGNCDLESLGTLHVCTMKHGVCVSNPSQAQVPDSTPTSVINSGRYLVFGGIHFSITIRPFGGQIGEILLAKKLTVRRHTSTSWRPLLSILSNICSLSWLALLRLPGQGEKKKKKDYQDRDESCQVPLTADLNWNVLGRVIISVRKSHHGHQICHISVSWGSSSCDAFTHICDEMANITAYRLVLFCFFNVFDKWMGLVARKWKFGYQKIRANTCKAFKMCWVLKYQTTLQESYFICTTYMEMET